MKKNRFTLVAFLLFACATAKVNAQTAKMQIVHNSPDITVDSVDVWANDVKIVNDLPFRKATQMLTIDSGDYVITISQKGSTDSSAAFSLLKVEPFRIDTSKTYLAFITGVVDTNLYATNPSGIDRSLSFVAIDNYKTTGTATQVALSFFNGTPDAGQWDLNEIGLPGLVKIGDDIGYKTFSPATLLTAANTVLNIASADSSSILAAYRLNMSVAGFKGTSACIFASGVNDVTGNPAQAALKNFYVVLNNGNIVPLTTLMGEVQLVHNSPDITNDSLDVYINDVLAYDNFAYRTATPFVGYKALLALKVAFAPQNSASVAEAFYTTTMTLDTNIRYHVIAHGLNTAGTYAANPNGKNTSFKVSSYRGVRKTASAPKNVDLLYFHAGTDLQTTTCRGDAQSQFLSKDDSYGDFHPYSAHTSLDNITMLFRDAVSDSVLYTGVANLALHQGQAGLVFASGFLDEGVANQNGDSLIMFVVWADGDVDSIAVPPPVTGINEQTVNNAEVSVFPNPATGAFSVSLNSPQQADFTVTVSDITGRMLMNNAYTLLSGSNRITVATETFNAGVYFVTVSSNGQSLTRKVTIIK